MTDFKHILNDEFAGQKIIFNILQFNASCADDEY